MSQHPKTFAKLSLIAGSILACGSLSLLSGSASAHVKSSATTQTALKYRGVITMYAGSFSPPPTQTKGIPTPKITILAKQWEALHPGIKIDFVQAAPPGSSYNTWALTEASGGKLPDITFHLYTDANNYFPAGTFVNLNPYWQEADPYVPGKTWAQDLRPSVIQDTQAPDGASYTVIGDWVNYLTFYNKVDFAKAGIKTVPTDWSQFLAACAKLKAVGITPFAYDLSASQTGIDVLTWPIQLFYTNLYGADNAKDLRFTGTPTVDAEDDVIAIKKGVYGNKNPAWMSFWSMMKNFSQYWEPGFTGSHPTAGFDTFVQGKAAMYWGGSWDLGGMSTSHMTFGWGSFADPSPDKAAWPYATSFNDGPHLGGPTGLFGFSIASHRADNTMTPAKEQATVNWLQYITTPSHDEEIVNQIGDSAPVAVGAKPLPKMSEIEQPGYFKTAPQYIWGGYWDTTQARSTIYRSFQEYMLGLTSLKTFGAQAEAALQTEANQLIAEHHWNIAKYLKPAKASALSLATTQSAHSFVEGSRGITLTLALKDAAGTSVAFTGPLTITATKDGVRASNVLIDGHAGQLTLTSVNASGTTLTVSDANKTADAGTYVLTITPKTSSVAATHVTFSETAGPVTQLKVIKPTATVNVFTNNPSTQYTFQLEDAYGNPVHQAGLTMVCGVYQLKAGKSIANEGTIDGHLTPPTDPYGAATDQLGQVTVTVHVDAIPGSTWVVYSQIIAQSKFPTATVVKPSPYMVEK